MCETFDRPTGFESLTAVVIPLIITELFLYKIYVLVDIGTGLIIHNLHAVLVIKQDGS